VPSARTGKEQWGTQLPGFKATAVNVQRQDTYGDPTPNMEMFAELLQAYFGWDVSVEDACMVMILLKVMREKQSDFDVDYEDNRIDICGWTNVLHQVVNRSEPE
jgi:hypothetical protein